jgi:HEXXH motif-containing protein
MSLAEQFAAFSLAETAKPEFVSRAAGIYGKAIVTKILSDEAAGKADCRPLDIEALYDRAAASGAACWHGGLAYAHDLHRRGPNAAPSALLQLILGFAQIGLQGRFEVQLPYNETFLLETNRFPCTGLVVVEAGSTDIVVSCAEEVFAFALTDGIWRPERDEDPAVAWSRNRRFLLCSGYRVDPAVLLPEDAPLDSVLIPAAHRSINSAVAHLETAGPAYVDWASRLVAQLSLVGSDNGNCLSSRSLSTRTGNVEMAVPGNDQHLAELMVHEAAHQHYYLAQLYAPLVRPEASAIRLYSAINGRYRPLDRVALAYHAIVNIYSHLEALCLGGSEIAESSRRRMDELSLTELSLRETLIGHDDKLTEFGQAFCRLMTEKGAAIIERQQVELVDAEPGQVRGVA